MQAATECQAFSKVTFSGNQRSQFTSPHILQLSFMSLPSCSSEQPLLVVFYLAATFDVSAPNCICLISPVNLLPACRSSKQQHFCAVCEHFRNISWALLGELHLSPSSLPESSAHTKNSLFVEICPKERDTGGKGRDAPLPKCLSCELAGKVNPEPSRAHYIPHTIP